MYTLRATEAEKFSFDFFHFKFRLHVVANCCSAVAVVKWITKVDIV